MFRYPFCNIFLFCFGLLAAGKSKAKKGSLDDTSFGSSEEEDDSDEGEYKVEDEEEDDNDESSSDSDGKRALPRLPLEE